jgi:photosystem II stability/assembly factor-like uncharacterized protein
VGTASQYGQTFATTNGSTWQAQTSVLSAQLYGVSCPSVTTCFDVGNDGVIGGTTDGGATKWQHLAPTVTGDVTAVSCPTTTTCFTVDATNGGIYRTADGKSWSQSYAVPGAGAALALGALSCASAAVCFVTGPQGSLYSTADGGQTWTAKALARPFTGISCATTSVCVATDSQGAVIRTVDGGANWSAPIPVSSSGLSGVSCPSASVCFAVDAGTPGRVYRSSDGGTSWTLSYNIANDPQAGFTGGFLAISCPNVSACFAGGRGGLIAATNDGGANWRTESSGSIADLTSISCPSASTCFLTASCPVG